MFPRLKLILVSVLVLGSTSVAMAQNFTGYSVWQPNWRSYSYGYGYGYGYSCQTDEGYGRRLPCASGGASGF